MLNLNQKICSANTLFFDMDGTLVDTNFANYLSYRNAIQQVVQQDINIPYNPRERFNREALKEVIPNLTEMEYDRIIQLKNSFFIEELSKTKVNNRVADILEKYCKTNETILVTNCREDRALITLKYHKLIDKFNHKFYRQKTDTENKNNKFENALTCLNISPNSVLVFENDDSEIRKAIIAGISERNIIKTDLNL